MSEETAEEWGIPPAEARDPKMCSQDHGACDARIESMAENDWSIECVDQGAFSMIVNVRSDDDEDLERQIEIPISHCPCCGFRFV